MTSKLDIDIYGALYQQKSITEKFLGDVSFGWHYSLVSYNADCTEGYPFDLFDKVIVGILQVDKELNIAQIGEILGMNVVHDPANQRYKDEAEFDILRGAIDRLVDFKMIETGDIYYNSCRVTDIGREYAAKGRKFKFVGNKEFAVYYDNTSGNNNQAKELFSKFNISGQYVTRPEVYQNEIQLKEICIVQQPEIYNLEKGNSFTNARVNRYKSFHYELPLHVALYYNLETREIRLVAYEPTANREIEYFSHWLNENQKQEILDRYFNGIDISETDGKIPDVYSAGIIALNKEFQERIIENAEDALKIARRANEESEYIDAQYFWRNVDNFIDAGATELYLFIPRPTANFLEVVEQLAKSVLPIPLFIVIEQSEDRKVQACIVSIKEYCAGSIRSVFVLETEQVKNFAVWIITDTTTCQYKDVSFYNEYGNNNVVIDVLEVSKINLSKAQPVCQKVKNLIAAEYLPLIYKIVSDYAAKQKARNENEINDKVIEFHKEVANKALVFDGLNLTEVDKITLANIKQEISGLIAFHTERWEVAIVKRFDELKLSYESKEVNELAELLRFSAAAQAILEAASHRFGEIKASIIAFQQRLRDREQHIKDDITAKSIVSNDKKPPIIRRSNNSFDKSKNIKKSNSKFRRQK